MDVGVDQQLLHYRILSKLGEGGMGVVWRALDTKLDREVAIKVLPAAFTADVERLVRFEREARLLASLNHPGIAGIHALEEGPEGRFLAMELVPGQDLAERLARGPLPLDETLDVARQIAEALEAAHASGVVHRDLKPANVKLTPQGTVKVLDFGLAKAVDPLPDSASFDLSISPTLTSAGTRAGMVIGTAAYMSPEQARGKPVDKRSDLWSFGCLLYECLTGVQLFQGETATDSLAAVLTKEPDWSALPSATPPLVRALLARCLTRDPKRRLQDAGDARIELELAIEDPNGGALGLEPAGEAAQGASAPRQPLLVRLLPWAVAAAAAVVAGVLALSDNAEPAPSPQVLRLTIPLAAGTVFDEFASSPPAISPDGKAVVYGSSVTSGDLRLWLRSLDSFGTRALDGTDGAQFAFWSPDSRHLAFTQNGRLKRIDVETGLQRDLDIEVSSSGRGGSWGPDGKILFAPNSNTGIFLIDAEGGEARQITTPNPEITDVSHRWPCFLPDGDHFLYVLWSNDLAAMEEHGGIYLASISDAAAPARRLFSDASSVAYVPPGYILMVRDDELLAVPFDADSRRLQGDASVVATGVFRNRSHAHAAFSASLDGTLVYSGAESRPPSQLTWLDREGQSLAVLDPAPILDLRLARGAGPGKGRAAYTTVGGNGDPEIWLLELGRGVRSRMISHSTAYDNPVFSGDGSEVLYSAQGPAGKTDFFKRAVDGSGDEEEVFVDENDKAPFDWSGDGRYVAYSSLALGIPRSPDIWVYSLADGSSQPLITEGASYAGARFSPDARWLAFDANDAGRVEVYVQAFEPQGGATRSRSRAGARFQVSVGGGSNPHWRDDGREIVYVDPESRFVVVTVEEREGRLEFGPPRTLFSLPGELAASDATGDHQNFLVALREEVETQPLYVVVNWLADL